MRARRPIAADDTADDTAAPARTRPLRGGPARAPDAARGAMRGGPARAPDAVRGAMRGARAVAKAADRPGSPELRPGGR